MGGVRGTRQREGGLYVGFWWGNVRKRDQLEGPTVDGKIIFRILKKYD